MARLHLCFAIPEPTLSFPWYVLDIAGFCCRPERSLLSCFPDDVKPDDSSKFLRFEYIDLLDLSFAAKPTLSFKWRLITRAVAGQKGLSMHRTVSVVGWSRHLDV